ncbi:lysine exporter LysO family protein [Acidianus brierleyi]|uniref:Lysine exporter LysO family protein n=1 Tax=Acidianus brierleyi TaxID=41673 RepID=A0A2U9IGL9_9CREN|nr:lysine exporter LysO family protein [Acidianus brierleyi]AWR95126.1 DUF340 domain-containing protein [Acidianus brierleyi]
MNFTITFILLYAISLAVGRKVKLPSVISDITVLLLIFSISFWGGNEVSTQAIERIVWISIVSSFIIVIITYFVGSFIRLKVKEGKIKLDWKTQVKYVLPLIFGFILGFLIKVNLPFGSIIDWELYLLAIVIGLSIGRDLKLEILKRISGIAIFSIFVAIFGGLISSIPLYFLGLRPFNLALSVSLGSGWYSYSGPIVAKYYGPIDGVIAFLINFLREQLTFSLVPLLLKLRSTPLGAIAVGGATSMDTTLGFYVDVLGYEYGIGAMINGVILTLIVPIVLPLILSL